MARTISFAEHSCWNGEYFRHVRRPVTFRLFSIGSALGSKVHVDVTADYGIWWHQDNETLIHMLSSACPSVDWGKLIYHRDWTSHSGIDIWDPESETLVARMEVRQYRGRRLDILERDLGPTVVRLDDYRTSKLNELPVHQDVQLMIESSSG